MPREKCLVPPYCLDSQTLKKGPSHNRDSKCFLSKSLSLRDWNNLLHLDRASSSKEHRQ